MHLMYSSAICRRARRRASAKQTDGFQTIQGDPGFLFAFAPAISGNGRYVSFTTEGELKLVSNDNNGVS